MNYTSVPSRNGAICSVALGIMVAVLDGSITNVALPTIARTLHLSAANSIWIVNGYLLAITVSLLALAAVGEMWGYRKVYMLGLALFVVNSLACSLAHTATTLIVARVLQGIGAACIISVNTALVRTIYPPKELGKGMGINSLTIAFSAAIGPSLAAAILTVASWNWLFVINIPICLVAILLGYRYLPSNDSPIATNALTPKRHFDYLGALLNALTLGLLIGVIDAISHQQSPWRIAFMVTLLLVFGTLFYHQQARHRTPLLPIDLLPIRPFTAAILATLFAFTAQMMALVALPFYIENNLGRTTLSAGLLLTPWALATMITAPLSGRLVERFSATSLRAIGLSLFAVGLWLLGTLPAHPTDADLILRMVLCGAGYGLFQPTNNSVAMTAAPLQRSGGASGLLGTARIVGQTCGAALVAMLFHLYPHVGTKLSLKWATLFALFGVVSVVFTRLKHHKDR